MTKRELVSEVATKVGLTQNEVSNIVQALLDSIVEALSEGERLEIRNFGVFEIKIRDARVGRNPRTGEEVPIPEKRVPSFKPGKALKELVQAGADVRPEGMTESPAPPARRDAPAAADGSEPEGMDAVGDARQSPAYPDGDSAVEPEAHSEAEKAHSHQDQQSLF